MRDIIVFCNNTINQTQLNAYKSNKKSFKLMIYGRTKVLLKSMSLKSPLISLRINCCASIIFMKSFNQIFVSSNLHKKIFFFYSFVLTKISQLELRVKRVNTNRGDFRLFFPTVLGSGPTKIDLQLFSEYGK